MTDIAPQRSAAVVDDPSHPGLVLVSPDARHRDEMASPTDSIKAHREELLNREVAPALAPGIAEAPVVPEAPAPEAPAAVAIAKVPAPALAPATAPADAANPTEPAGVDHEIHQIPEKKPTPPPPDSSRAKGALQQTIGSTKEALGELLHMEGLRKAGEEQRKQGEMREELAMRRDAGSGVVDTLETKIRKVVQTMKGERKGSASSESGATKRQTSVSSIVPDENGEVHTAKEEGDGEVLRSHSTVEPAPGPIPSASNQGQAVSEVVASPQDSAVRTDAMAREVV